MKSLIGNPRVLVIAGAAVIVALAVIVSSLFSPRGVRPGQNVIVILLDTARRDALGCYGHPGDPTPNIDAIGADGVRFTKAMASSGWTLPSVASLLTGTWPTIHGGVGRDATLHPIREELPTAGEVLGRAGMRTFGFANAAFFSPMLGLDRGFDHFDHRYAYNFDYRPADETMDAVLPVLRANRDAANFILIHLFDPHLDYRPPAKFAARFVEPGQGPPPPLTSRYCETTLKRLRSLGPNAPPVRYIRGVYQAEVAFADDQVGRLVRELKSLDLYDEATIIVTSDHGEEFLDHGGFEHGHTLYQELVHVPLIIKPPRSARLGSGVAARQVRQLDVMPTVFEMLDVAKPPTFCGDSLLALMRGESGEDRYAFFESISYGEELIAGSDGNRKVIVSRPGSTSGRTELYDLQTDPLERRNIADADPRAERLRRALLEFHERLLDEAEELSPQQTVDLSPTNIKRLRSLGYIR